MFNSKVVGRKKETDQIVIDKRVKELSEKQIDKICNRQIYCNQCPLFTYIDNESVVGVCAAEFINYGPEGLRRIAKVLDSKIVTEE